MGEGSGSHMQSSKDLLVAGAFHYLQQEEREGVRNVLTEVLKRQKMPGVIEQTKTEKCVTHTSQKQAKKLLAEAERVPLKSQWAGKVIRGVFAK